MSDDLSVAEILEAGADYIQTHGLMKGCIGQDGGPRCIVGAIRSVMGLGPEPWFSFPLKIQERRDSIADVFFQVIGQSPSQFNDLYSRTAEECIDAMLEAAAHAHEEGL